MSKRIVSWFSCGAASTVATKLVLSEKPNAPIIIAYTEVMEEHPDNRRFLKECEKWFGQEIIILRNEDYSGSIYEVFRKTRFLKGPHGAACTRLLKKSVRKEFQQPGDIQIFGYTADKTDKDRADRLIDANPELCFRVPLIEQNLTKADCLAMIERAGIKLPTMYLLGYQNNNCIGCVKGEAGYWNKIRRDFPEVFERMAQMEEQLGRTVCKREWTENGKRMIERIPLRQLSPDAGKYDEEPDIECSIFCHMAEKEIRNTAFSLDGEPPV